MKAAQMFRAMKKAAERRFWNLPQNRAARSFDEWVERHYLETDSLEDYPMYQSAIRALRRVR